MSIVKLIFGRLRGLLEYLKDYEVVGFSVFLIFNAFIIWGFEYFFFENLATIIGFVLFAVLLAILFSRKLIVIFLLSLVIIFLRIYYYLGRESQVKNSVEGYINDEVELQGYIVEEPRWSNDRVKLIFKGELGAEQFRFLTSSLRYPRKQLGETCTIKGQVKKIENFTEEFDYEAYMRNKQIYYQILATEMNCNNSVREGSNIRNWLFDFKWKLIESIESKMPEPQSSLLIGILLGEDRVFSEEFDNALRVSGTTHIVAASGYNITFLVMGIDKIFAFLNKKLRMGLALVFIWAFVLISGISASIVRAAIMGCITIFGLLMGFKSSVKNILFITAAVYILANPRIIFDLGFQLSFAATLGLLFLMPAIISLLLKLGLLKKDSEGKRNLNFLSETFLSTLSCTLLTLPITIYNFKQFSIISVFCNLFVLPVLEDTMIVGLLALGISVFSSRVSTFILLIPWIQLKYFEIVVNGFSKLGFGYITVTHNVSVAVIVLIFLILFIMSFYESEEESYYFNL